MDRENRPVSIWFAPWNWRREEFRRLAIWAVVVVMIFSSLAPGVFPRIVQGIGDLCLINLNSWYEMLNKLME